jgi:sarcosine oxidase
MMRPYMSNNYDVIIIGLGAMGSAAAFHCARRGLRTLALEQFDTPHTRGSSHGHSRMIRLAYYEHPDYVPLLRGAYDLWDELESLSRQKLLHRTGGVYIGPGAGHVVPGALRAARHHNLPHEPLSRADLAERYPMFALPDDYTGVFEPAAGFLIPERCVAAHAEQALRHGANLHAHEPVVGWSATPTAVTVRTPKAAYHAARLIFCSGPWTSQLLRTLPIPLVVTRQLFGWVWPTLDPDRFSLGRFPVWGIEQPDGSLAYGFPTHPEAPGLKLARHFPGTLTHPDTVSRDITPGDESEIHSILSRYLPSAVGPTLALRTCLYTNSPDGHFLVDRLPNHPNVLLAAGFSGHGFKFASIIGRALADLATDDGRTDLPLAFLSLARFPR